MWWAGLVVVYLLAASALRIRYGRPDRRVVAGCSGGYVTVWLSDKGVTVQTTSD